MELKTLPTRFLPAERASDEQVETAYHSLLGDPYVKVCLDAVPEPVLILNRERQIVLFNGTAREYLLAHGGVPQLGLRPGEALRCARSTLPPSGCGTTDYCTTCGLARAFVGCAKALRDARGEAREARILQAGTDEAFDMRVWATRLSMGGADFVMLVLQDTADEYRRRALERSFFHDVLNTAAGLRGAADLLTHADAGEAKDFGALVGRLADRLIDEISAQRQLADAERGGLKSHLEPTEALAVLREAADSLASLEAARDRFLRVDPASAEVRVVTDRVLLRRVLVNLVKNAYEASRPGQTVTLGCRRDAEGVELWVHNQGVMPREARLQVFERSFTTKGPGRGLGTYGAKLLTERYLGGTVDFHSDEATGTRFRVLLPPRPC